MNSTLSLSNSLFKLSVFQSFRYTPHTKQLSVHLSNARFKIVAAGARAGKSMLAGAEGAFALLFPSAHVWYVSSVYELADKEFDWTLDFLARLEVGNKRVIDLAHLNNPARGSRRIEFPWGSWAETKSSQKPETLLGEEIDLLIMGEASQMGKAAWERQLYARLGPRRGRVLAISTPNWDAGFFRDLYERGNSESPDDLEYESWNFSVLANPTFPQEEYEKARKLLDEKVFAEQYEGQFVSRRGYVFPQFGDHNIAESLPEEHVHWPIFRAWHHEKNSFNNPVVCLAVAIDPETRDLWVIDEFYQAGVLPEDVAVEMRERTRGRRVIGNVTDFRNPTLRDTLRKHAGTVTTNDEKKYPAKHAIVRRLQALQTDLRPREDGTAKIKVSRKCERTLDNFERAKWPDPKPDQAEMAEVELPTTRYMGAPLALSYLVAYMKLAAGEDIYRAQAGAGKK